NYLCYWRAGSLRASGSEIVWFVHSTVPSVWHQSAHGLQMAGSVPPSRAAGFAQLLAPAQTFAPANGRTLAAGVASTAPPPSPLGSKENSRLLAAGSPPRPAARRAYIGQMDQPVLSGQVPPPALDARTR